MIIVFNINSFKEYFSFLLAKQRRNENERKIQQQCVRETHPVRKSCMKVDMEQFLEHVALLLQRHKINKLLNSIKCYKFCN